MSKKRAHATWEPFAPASTGRDLDPFEACFKNNRYTVFARRVVIPADSPHLPGLALAHLSIKRNDKNPLRDWRHLQRIKNELVGKENEAVELYPAESRLVDEANQYHLYVALDPEFRFPWGSLERIVGGAEEAAEVGARQRPFDEEVAS